MRIIVKAWIALGLLAAALPAAAQDEPGQEIMVTGTRIADSGSPRPAVVLRRTADFAIQLVRITGDTRDETRRRDEVYAMLKGAIQLAPRYGVELATGEYIVEPLTLANYTNVTLEEDEERDDAEGAGFLIKTPLAPGIDAKTALERITRFVKAVPTVGRAQLEAQDDLTLSVVSPDQYRGQIIELIAADAAKTVAKFGPGYAVTVTGLDRPVEWARAGLTDVTLYLPAAYTVVPKP